MHLTDKNSENNGFAALLLDYGASPIAGGLIGVLVGDAVGVPWEFYPPENLPTRDLIDMVPPDGFARAHDVPNGTYSDDSAQTLILLDSLLACGTLNLTDFANRLLRWYDEGYMAVDGQVFDCGLQTERAIDRLRDGVLPLESGAKDERSNGNGSVMRCLPLALWHTGSDEALVRDAHLQSLPTHAHPRSLVCCAYLCMVARGYLHGLHDPWTLADQRLADIYDGWSNDQERQVLLHELDVLRNFLKNEQPRGSGYVLDCLASAKKAMEEDSFEEVIKTAILFGHDTDTSAAVAGGLAGIRHRLRSIPLRWLEQLRGFELVEPLIYRFTAAKRD